jgi:hypothetical protein
MINVEAISLLEGRVNAALAALGHETPETAHETQALRDLSIRAKKLRRAASRPQALGFFGPSQAGKSFLVGALLSHELGTLEVLSRGKTLDFLKEINPAKGVESTGVVTRFSTAPMPAPLSRGDFYCRLLSLETVLESMATGFLVECTSPPVDPERVEKVMRDARLASGTAAGPVYREAWELVWHGLLKKYQDRHPYLNDLKRQPGLSTGAWKGDIKTTEGWLLVYSLLWGGHGYAPDLDKLMRLVIGGLELVGHAEAIEAEAASIRASSAGHSLIDAACLNSIGTTKNTVTVFVSGSGGEVRVEPGVLSALIAEIHLPLRPSAGSLLDRADILDFPGGRALKGINGFGPGELTTGRLDNAVEVYKRGKLTFLFEQYALDREITALCLCSPGPTKPEAIQLQSQVESWLKIRYGAATPKTPGEVDRPSLFMALTKFDMSLGALRSDNAMARWESRVQEACVDFWARSPSSWIHHWGQKNRAFSNMFWIRNPYADQMRALSPGEPDYELIKKGYQEARAVQRHIESPMDKWGAVEGEEHGMPRSGVPLLASAFKVKLAENVKAREVAEEAASIHGELLALLKALTPSRDETELRSRLTEAASLLVDAVAREMERRSSGAVFGELLGHLSADEGELEAEVHRMVTMLAPQSIKTSDKVKRLIVHMVKWWRDQATMRVRTSQLNLPVTAVDTFVREVCQSKKLLVALGTAVFPYMSRTVVDANLIAGILRVKIVDMMAGLGVASERSVVALPVRLSFAEDTDAAEAAGAIDWSDVNFDAEEPEALVGKAEIVFAGNRFFQRWRQHLGPFYLESGGQKLEGTAGDGRTAELVKILREVEGLHVGP